MLNGSLRIEHILVVTLKKGKRKDEASPFHPLHYQRITVDDHERGLIVFTAGSRQIEGISLLAHPSPAHPTLPICLFLVIATRRLQEFLSTCWWLLGLFQPLLPIEREGIQIFIRKLRRKCSRKVISACRCFEKYSLWRL